MSQDGKRKVRISC